MTGDDVVSFYGTGSELSRLETGHFVIEAARTKELITRHLQREASVLDVGGGPGYYASWLAASGHAVHVVDPVPLHIETVARRQLAGTLGDARELPFEDASWDAVLLLGPLYHLPDRDDRLTAWREALRVCRPGGVILAAAISRFAPALDGVLRGWIGDAQAFETVQMVLDDGWRYDGAPTTFPSAYYHQPDELSAEAAEAGLRIDAVYGIEGPGWLMGGFEEKWADEVMRERLIWLARLFEQDPQGRAISNHLLLAAHRST